MNSSSAIYIALNPCHMFSLVHAAKEEGGGGRGVVVVVVVLGDVSAYLRQTDRVNKRQCLVKSV